MDVCYDSDVSTEIVNERNIRALFALLMFWAIGMVYPVFYPPVSYARMEHLEFKRFPDDLKFKFDRHLNSEEIYDYLQSFAKFHDNKAKFFAIEPKTYENRNIRVFRIKTPNYFGDIKREKIIVIAALYASIWDSTSAAIHLVHKLCEDCIYKVLYTKSYDWYIIPVANPDGYDYSLAMRDIALELSASPKNRVFHNIPENVRGCRGVYIERNFGFHWGESKPIDYEDYCWMGFAGPYPFSENETKALARFTENLVRKSNPIFLLVQLHGNLMRDILNFPWRYTNQRAYNFEVLNSLAKVATHNVNEKTGFYFTWMQSGVRDLGSGLLSDYMMGFRLVKYAFSIEPYFEVLNSTDVPSQDIYVEKTDIIVTSLLNELRNVNNKI